MAVGESPEQAANPTMPASTPASRMILPLRFMNQLPGEYDLLGMWTDAQLAELQCPGLIKQAWAQRVENIKAKLSTHSLVLSCLVFSFSPPV